MGVRGDMESGGSLYRTNNGESSVVYNAQIYTAPLLPFEKQLIATIGATEEEYRYLVSEAIKKGRKRPAGYEHIPDIRTEGVTIATILVNLAIGVTLSVITYLLTPKPKKPKAGDRRTLESINQAGRFTPTFGFDSLATLGNFNDPIPIIFGRAIYRDSIYQGGGLLTTPSLVWSRMFSWGSQQSIKQLLVVGEQGITDGISPEGINLPKLQGIFLGNTPLDAIFENSYAFYWKKHHSGDDPVYRIRAGNFHYGTRGTPDAGDPETNDDIFLCPTNESDAEEAFCSAHNLSNNADFGVYSPVANGTCYRTNWSVITWPDIEDQTDDPGDVLNMTIRKIAGTAGYSDERFHGMPGTGRNYSIRMGLTRVLNADRSTKHAQPTNLELFKVVEIEKGDIAVFEIRPGNEKLDGNWLIDGKVSVGDINSAVDSFRERADDMLQLGEIFQIGRTYWQVIKRSLSGSWKADGPDHQFIDLKCIDDDSSPNSTNEIGLNSLEALRPEDGTRHTNTQLQADWPLGQWLTSTSEATGYVNAKKQPWEPRYYVANAVEFEGPVPGPDHFPLLRVARALIKSTRECDVTEIGIKSRVYTELSGLCNFQNLPTPDQLQQFWRDRTQITSGTVNTYIKRASTFVIMVRPAGVQDDGSSYEWEQLGVAFAVIGKSPVDLYNSIRITHPQRGRYEYEMKPMTGATLHRQWEGKPYIVLNASGTETITRNLTTTNYGMFKVKTKGYQITKIRFQKNKEFIQDPAFNEGVFEDTFPSEVSPGGHVTPGIDGYIQRIFTMEWVETVPQSGRVGGIASAFNHEIFGTPDRAPGQRKSVWVRETLADGRMINIAWTGEVKACPGHWAGVDKRWIVVEHTFRHPGSEFGKDEVFTITKTISNSNPFRVAQGGASGPNLSTASKKYRVTTHSGTLERANHGKAHGVRWEVFGSADSYNIGDTKTVTKDFNKTLGGVACKLRLELTATVIYQDQQQPINGWPGITKSWAPPVINVIQGNDTTLGWEKYDDQKTFEDNAEASKVVITETTGNTNPFFLPGKTIQWRFTITDRLSEEVHVPSISGEREFETNSQYADISHYGDLVRRSNDSSPEHTVAYVNEILDNSIGESDFVPEYNNLVLAGLSLRAGRNFSQIDQIRFWLKEGLHVKRLHPDLATNTEIYGNSRTFGASNLFTDLVYHLLTDTVSGAGNLLGITDSTSDDLVDEADMIETSKFLYKNELWCNGVIGEPLSMREFIASTAPLFLCDAVIKEGRFSIRPAIPVTTDGDINHTGAVTIKQLFTAGNIIEESFNVNYLGSEERRAVQAVVRYRKESEFGLPKEETVAISLTRNVDSLPEGKTLPIETFDLTKFCTTRHHAELAGKYFLSLRDRVTHMISFSTTPHGLDLAPGDLIKVSTETTPFSSATTGSINASGVIVSASTISNGQHSVLYYKTGIEEDVTSGTMTVSDGVVSDSTFHNSIFTLQVTTDSQDVYRVESITLNEEMIVEISASEFPCDENSVSLIAEDLDPDNIGRYIIE